MFPFDDVIMVKEFKTASRRSYIYDKKPYTRQELEIPAPDFKGHRQLAIPVCIAARAGRDR